MSGSARRLVFTLSEEMESQIDAILGGAGPMKAATHRQVKDLVILVLSHVKANEERLKRIKESTNAAFRSVALKIEAVEQAVADLDGNDGAQRDPVVEPEEEPVVVAPGAEEIPVQGAEVEVQPEEPVVEDNGRHGMENHAESANDSESDSEDGRQEPHMAFVLDLTDRGTNRGYPTFKMESDDTFAEWADGLKDHLVMVDDRMSELRKVAALKCKLSRYARTRFDALTNEQTATFDAAVAALTPLLDTEEDSVMASARLKQLPTLKPSESVIDYSERLERMVRRALNNENADVIATTLKIEFLNRLPRNLAVYVRDKKPQTFQEAVQLARGREALLCLPFDDERSPPVAVALDETERLRAEIEELRRQIAEFRPQRRSPPEDRFMDEVRCYGCQEFGHLRRNCPRLNNGPMPTYAAARPSQNTRPAYAADQPSSSEANLKRQLDEALAQNKKLAAALDAGVNYVMSVHEVETPKPTEPAAKPKPDSKSGAKQKQLIPMTAKAFLTGLMSSAFDYLFGRVIRTVGRLPAEVVTVEAAEDNVKPALDWPPQVYGVSEPAVETKAKSAIVGPGPTASKFSSISVRLGANGNRRMTVAIAHVNGIAMQALLDTGATITIIPLHMASWLGVSGVRKSDMAVTSVSKQTLAIHSTARILVRFGDRTVETTGHFVDQESTSPNFDVILGTDTLSKFGKVMFDWDDDVMRCYTVQEQPQVHKCQVSQACACLPNKANPGMLMASETSESVTQHQGVTLAAAVEGTVPSAQVIGDVMVAEVTAIKEATTATPREPEGCAEWRDQFPVVGNLQPAEARRMQELLEKPTAMVSKPLVMKGNVCQIRYLPFGLKKASSIFSRIVGEMLNDLVILVVSPPGSASKSVRGRT